MLNLRVSFVPQAKSSCSKRTRERQHQRFCGSSMAVEASSRTVSSRVSSWPAISACVTRRSASFFAARLATVCTLTKNLFLWPNFQNKLIIYRFPFLDNGKALPFAFPASGWSLGNTMVCGRPRVSGSPALGGGLLGGIMVSRSNVCLPPGFTIHIINIQRAFGSKTFMGGGTIKDPDADCIRMKIFENVHSIN